MSGSTTGPGFGARGFGSRPMGTGQPFSDAFDQLRSMFEHRMGPQPVRRDVRGAVLALLAEKPMHGYQIISEIERRSGGAWTPSAGSVYPTLQLLSDEGLISAEMSDGRKVYSLTEAGQAEADAAAGTTPWGESHDRHGVFGALPKAGMDLAQAAAQVRRTGTPEQVRQAVEVLDEARRKLYSILAQD
jgi:DNA-binding PadR family transcriptional regulator